MPYICTICYHTSSYCVHSVMTYNDASSLTRLREILSPHYSIVVNLDSLNSDIQLKEFKTFALLSPPALYIISLYHCNRHHVPSITFLCILTTDISSSRKTRHLLLSEIVILTNLVLLCMQQACCNPTHKNNVPATLNTITYDMAM